MIAKTEDRQRKPELRQNENYAGNDQGTMKLRVNLGAKIGNGRREPDLHI